MCRHITESRQLAERHQICLPITCPHGGAHMGALTQQSWIADGRRQAKTETIGIEVGPELNGVIWVDIRLAKRDPLTRATLRTET